MKPRILAGTKPLPPILTILATLALAMSCSAPAVDFDCRSAADCDVGFCVSGDCVPTTRVAPLDGGPQYLAADGALVTPGGAGDVGDPIPKAPCSGAVPASTENVALNEVLVHVPTGPQGDANSDGVRDAYDDEFVELANISDGPIDMRGVSIYSSGKLKFVFEPWCLLAGEAVVVFGGGSVGAAVTSKAAISDTRFAFGNDGGLVTITTPQGEIARVEYGRSDAASLTRAPQLVGQTWVPHTALSPLPFSPGACPDGSAMASGCVAPEKPGVAADGGMDGGVIGDGG